MFSSLDFQWVLSTARVHERYLCRKLTQFGIWLLGTHLESISSHINEDLNPQRRICHCDFNKLAFKKASQRQQLQARVLTKHTCTRRCVSIGMREDAIIYVINPGNCTLKPDFGLAELLVQGNHGPSPHTFTNIALVLEHNFK